MLAPSDFAQRKVVNPYRVFSGMAPVAKIEIELVRVARNKFDVDATHGMLAEIRSVVRIFDRMRSRQ